MVMSSPNARRVRLEADDRREQMIAVAQSIFAARSYDAVSTEDLARAAGTTRTNLNYHFGNKRELYVEVLRRFAEMPAQLPCAVEQTDVPVSTAARDLLSRWLNLVEANAAAFAALMRAQQSADEEIAAILRGSLVSWEDRLLSVTRMEPSRVSRARVRAFQGMISAATSEWLEHQTMSKEEVLDLLVRGVVALAE
ncbi:TetR/AcrR family transcriptional regulator [Gordonia sp. ABKF26]|uniref:TetR/AcrR family transcriptional regulator n=1 Tax=Gordonia sp. ABKF26 TaxID=3238687 RepID=UPI0034E4EEEB